MNRRSFLAALVCAWAWKPPSPVAMESVRSWDMGKGVSATAIIYWKYPEGTMIVGPLGDTVPNLCLERRRLMSLDERWN